MTIAFSCSNCGKEAEKITNLYRLEFGKLLNVEGESEDVEGLGEFCEDCKGKLEKIIKEGFS